MINFETTERIAAVPPSLMQVMYPQLLEQYGEYLTDNKRQILTICGNCDDDAKTRIRAASLDNGTIKPIPLKDGRVAFRFLWQKDLAAAFDAGQIDGVEQLTTNQYLALLPDAPTEP